MVSAWILIIGLGIFCIIELFRAQEDEEKAPEIEKEKEIIASLEQAAEEKQPHSED